MFLPKYGLQTEEYSPRAQISSGKLPPTGQTGFAAV